MIQQLAPTTAYLKFFAKFKEIDTLPIQNWNLTHALGYFCQQYRQYYGFDYSFQFKKAPSQSDEMVHIKRIALNLSSDPQILKQYIDWIFTTKVVQRKKKITTIAFLAHQEVINEFKFKILAAQQPLLNHQIDRTTNLPDKILNKIYTINQEIKTYGDLSFILQMETNYKNELLILLANENFNLEILEKIK